MINKLDNPFFLAPMAGITDSAFRLLCREEGCGLSYSEMVSAKAMYYGDKKTETLLKIREGEDPVAFQIFGSEPEVMAFAAEKLNDRNNVLLDINMGCPVPKVFKNGDGSALMKNPRLIREITEATVRASAKPVSVKMRLGVNAESINVAECALAAEAGGAALVAVHGRTRDQYYSGKADWDSIKMVKEALTIPLIGNGDVFSAEDALRMMDYTGCDAVMVGRGALGNPWIFREIKAMYDGRPVPERPSLMEISEMMNRHLNLMAEFKSDRIAVFEMRKHVGWYLKGVRGASEMRRKINTINDIDELRAFIRSVGEGAFNR